LSKQSLSQYENGSIPDHERVIKIAKELSFPYDYFMQEDHCKAETEVTYFRSLASATKMSRTAQSTKLEFVAKIYELLLHYIDFPQLNIPKVAFNGSYDEFDNKAEHEMAREIEEIAQCVRHYWNLNNEPIKNLQLLLEKNGIIVTGFDVNTTKIDAFSQRIMLDGGEVFFIAVTQGKMPEVRITFDMPNINRLFTAVVKNAAFKCFVFIGR
jgi:transcriptional regulator with XRE-family HTH domain